MKKGIIASVNDKNKNVARLITGEIVLGTKDQPMVTGNIVTYLEEKQTRRYATVADVTAGLVPAITNTDGSKMLIDIPAEQQRDVNRIAGVFADQNAFVAAFAKNALLDVHVQKEVKKQTLSLEELYA